MFDIVTNRLAPSPPHCVICASTLEYLVRYLASDRSGVTEIKSSADVNAVGHRVVHGGEQFTESALIDDKVLKGIEDCIDLAPLHNPNNIKCILAARELFGKCCPAGCGFRYVLPSFASRAGLSVRGSLSSLSPPSHPPLRVSRHLSSLRGLSISRPARDYSRANQHHHPAFGKRLFGRRHQGWLVGRYLHGHDASRRTGDGYPFGRPRSRYC